MVRPDGTSFKTINVAVQNKRREKEKKVLCSIEFLPSMNNKKTGIIISSQTIESIQYLLITTFLSIMVRGSLGHNIKIYFKHTAGPKASSNKLYYICSYFKPAFNSHSLGVLFVYLPIIII